jgi:serine/threonine-protein kinase
VSTPRENAKMRMALVTDDTRERRHVDLDAGDGPRPFLAGEDIPGADLRVVQKLGEGGFGTVYECVDLHLRVPVAVKLLNADVERAPEIEHIFASEAATLAGLDSDFIVRVRRFGFTREARPRPYLVMFKLEGSTLLTVLSTLGRLSLHDTLLYGIHVGLGLSIAHAKNLVHRDIKPANIFLAKVYDPILGAEVTRAVILDFGIARAASTGASKATGFFGSHPYAPPEQYFGRALPQGDLYALAVTMFIMLTGEHPLGMLASDREWVQAKLKGTIPYRRINETIREINRKKAPNRRLTEVDAELDELIARCLSPKPEDRPGTAEAFVRALEVVFEREKERLAAEEAARLEREGKPKPVRGARTVPEPPTWMQERITAHYQTTGHTPEAPAARDAAEQRKSLLTPDERAAAIARRERVERFARGETGSMVSGAGAVISTLLDEIGHVDDFAGMDAGEVNRQLILSGSTKESPDAAVRHVARVATSIPRVTFADGADGHAPAPADADYRRKAQFRSEARREPVSLPLAGPFHAAKRAGSWWGRVRGKLYHPERGTHWRVVALVVSVTFFLVTMLVVVGVRTYRWSRGSVAAASTAEPQAPASSAASIPAATSSASVGLLPLPAAEVTPVPVATTGAAAGANARGSAVVIPVGHTTGTTPKSGPPPHGTATSSPGAPAAAAPSPASPASRPSAAVAPTPPSPSPSPPASCPHCGLIDEPKPTKPTDITHKID